jgi:hypothetical protein
MKPQPQQDPSEPEAATATHGTAARTSAASTTAETQNDEEEPRPKVEEAIRLEDFYGSDKAYPEPYLAGKVPNSVAYSRFESRSKGMKFIYSVRFRAGPFGMSFDNKVGSVLQCYSTVRWGILTPLFDRFKTAQRWKKLCLGKELNYPIFRLIFSYVDLLTIAVTFFRSLETF